jgi:small basic protein (TIGR04137 family)
MWTFFDHLRCGMSLDRSLKSASSLVRHRNVLSRAERIDKLVEMEKWDDKKSVYGLPKVGHRKAAEAKAEPKEAVEGAASGAAAPAAVGSKAPAPAAGAKGAAPAAGAKGAAPAPAGKAAAAPAAKKK